AAASPVNVQLLLSSGGEEVSGLGWQFSDVEPRAVVRLFSPLFTITGGIALIGGAFYSYLTWQLSIRKQSGRFSLGTGFFNIYLGGGALVLAIGGAGSGFGYGTLYVSEIISVVLMYFGFLESDKISGRKLWNVLSLKWLRQRSNPDPTL
ncbi:MAG TPA: hypothetical protein VJ044_20560, partial [Candidatus Hodarchaeales archaeon]|nr:hypothetical protein [Candidatus Hodarchaeales archaeon]